MKKVLLLMTALVLLALALAAWLSIKLCFS